MKSMSTMAKSIIVITVILTILCIIPLYRLPLILNDELQTRYYSGLGIGVFFDHYISDWIRQGRVMSIFVNTITMYLGFISQDVGVYKIEQSIVLILCSITFGILITRLFKNKYFGLFCAITSVFCYTIVFEHTAPNAFVSMHGILMIILFISLTLFVEYLRNEKKWMLIVSMLLFLVTMISAEAFITFVPLYCAIALMLNHIGEKKLLSNVKWPILAGVVFLILYVISRILFPSHYPGNQFTWPINIGATLKTILDLFLANIPGFYLINPKYIYFFSTHTSFSIWYSIRVFAVALLIIAFLYLLRKVKTDEIKQNRSRFLIIVLIGILMSIMPLTPTSVSSIWCGATGDQILALPTNFLAYYCVIFTICYIIWWAIRNKKTIYPFLAVTVAVVVIIAPIQLSNDFYSEDARNDYQTGVICVEEFVSSDEIAKFGVDSYCAPDFYDSRHLLGFIDGYWTMYSQSHGQGIEFNKLSPKITDNRVYLLNDSIFEIWHNGSLSLMSKNELPQTLYVKLIDDQIVHVLSTNVHQSNNWYICDCVII